MRGGLDDALDKLARRDELRRRATGESPSTPPAVTELVEAIAGVVSRNPHLGVTVGVEGAGDPVLLHFAFVDGVVQVNADNRVANRVAGETAPRHADFDIDPDEPVEDAYQPPVRPPSSPPPRGSHDDQDRFGPTDYEYHEPAPEPPTAERPFVSAPRSAPPAPASAPPATPAPHPFAAAPPPAVPHASHSPYAPPQQHSPYAPPLQHPEQPPFAAPAPFTAQHAEPTAPPEPRPTLEPLANPIPFQAERPEETEQAARRLAAMLRNDPTLLDNTQQ
ncbi:hypothetical protein [Actinoplanes sp. NPDC051851]|uniref:hypothetical protein n=1 Tax=Actinoplanes sp. NPDC051851 TaxID=3154753 RepID=UPI003416B913